MMPVIIFPTLQDRLNLVEHLVETVTPELEADDICGLVEGQHERQFLPVQIQGVW